MPFILLKVLTEDEFFFSYFDQTKGVSLRSEAQRIIWHILNHNLMHLKKNRTLPVYLGNFVA